MAEYSPLLPIEDATFLSNADGRMDIVSCCHYICYFGLVQLRDGQLGDWLQLIIHYNDADELKGFFDLYLLSL